MITSYSIGCVSPYKVRTSASHSYFLQVGASTDLFFSNSLRFINSNLVKKVKGERIVQIKLCYKFGCFYPACVISMFANSKYTKVLAQEYVKEFTAVDTKSDGDTNFLCFQYCTSKINVICILLREISRRVLQRFEIKTLWCKSYIFVRKDFYTNEFS